MGSRAVADAPLANQIARAWFRTHSETLRNTPAINAQVIKNRCAKGSGLPAFAHLLGAVLVELGLHQPLAAAFGWQGEGELTLARIIFSRHSLPRRRECWRCWWQPRW